MDRVRDGRNLMQNDGMEKPWMPQFPVTPEQQRIFNEALALLAAAVTVPEHPNHRAQYQRIGEQTV